MTLADWKLVYIDNNHIAYFSAEKEPWGDDWDDAPYEWNAGPPYEKSVRVALMPELAYHVPSKGHINSPYTVKQINRGAIAWLHIEEKIPVPAWTPLDAFLRLLRDGGYLDSVAIFLSDLTASERSEALEILYAEPISIQLPAEAIEHMQELVENPPPPSKKLTDAARKRACNLAEGVVVDED